MTFWKFSWQQKRLLECKKLPKLGKGQTWTERAKLCRGWKGETRANQQLKEESFSPNYPSSLMVQLNIVPNPRVTFQTSCHFPLKPADSSNLMDAQSYGKKYEKMFEFEAFAFSPQEIGRIFFGVSLVIRRALACGEWTKIWSKPSKMHMLDAKWAIWQRSNTRWWFQIFSTFTPSWGKKIKHPHVWKFNSQYSRLQCTKFVPSM